MSPRIAFAFIALFALAACGKGPAKVDEKNAAPAALQLSAEDLHVVKNNTLAGGPAITGSIQPERRADLRAEISSVVVQVLRENGDAVRRGDLLVRLDDTAIRESLASAEAATRAATQAFEQAKRQLERATTLRASGMVSAAALEDAETRRNNAQSELEGARTRVAQAKQQLTRTEVRAPFDGLVSDRKVSAGDTAQIGKELLKVIDPGSMRFEGLVSADHVGELKAGLPVFFRVNGYGETEFAGKVRRVNPSANAATRQVEVLVDFSNGKQPKLAGLYAEGRIETGGQSALTIPSTALMRQGDNTEVWRVRNGALEKVAVALGERDARSGDLAIKGGLAEGDQLIRYPNSALKPGQSVALSGAAKTAPVAAK